MWSVFKNVRVLGAVIVVAGIAVMAMWPEAIEIDVVTATRAPMEVTIDEEGETRVRDRFVVSAPVAGRLERIELEPGDAVGKGAIVARLVPGDAPLLDPRARAELSAAVDAATAMLAQARAERDRAAAALEQTRDTSKRREQLMEAGLLSREELESSRTAVATATSTLRAAEAAVTQAAHQVDVARARLQFPERSGGRAIDVRSPVPGVVLKRMHESEAVVAAGEPLIEIGDPSRIEIVSDLLSTDAVRVRPGSAARIEDWGGGTPLEARVRRVEPSGFMKVSALGVEEQRVNVILDVVDGAAARALGDGYRVEVRIVMWRSDDVLTVPTGSLFRRGDQWAVFVVAGNRAELRNVELGHRNSDAGEIVKGLQPGDQVVLHPPDTLEDGARVRRRES